jgi:hypothetical protein
VVLVKVRIWNRLRFSGGRQRRKRTIMKIYSLSGARIAQLSCVAFVLLGFSQRVQAGPASTSPNYSVAVFANAPSGLTNPDSITSFQGTIWVGYQNNSQPTGAGESDIVQFDPTGKALKTFKVKGRNDGLKYNPFDGKIYALQNEDGNPYLTLIDPVTGTTTNYSYSTPPAHGGGYDDIVFLNGQIFISASNPILTPPSKTYPFGQNIYPSIIKATLVAGNQIDVTPVEMGNATLIDVTTGKSVVAAQSDPDSLKVDPSGNVVLDSQEDGDLIFLNGPGFPNQVGYRLHLSSSSTTQVTVDDTVFPTQAAGTIYVADTPANIVYAITSKVFPPDSAFTSATDTNNYEGRIDLQTGKITPIITGLQGPHGALFVSTLPEVRLDQVGSSGGLTGVFRVSRTGDVSQALQVFLNINDNSSADPSSSNTQKSVTIPVGASSATVAVALDSKGDFKEDGSKQSVVVSIQPDPSYQVQPVNLQTGVQVLSLPLSK